MKAMKPKQNLFFTAVISLFIITFAACVPKEYTITGEIPQAEGKTVLLSSGLGFVKTSLDRTVVRDGKFQFQGKHLSPELLTIKVSLTDETEVTNTPPRSVPHPVIPVFVTEGTLHIEAVLDSIPLENFSGIYDYTKVTITGSEMHDLYAMYMKHKIRFANAHGEAQQAYSAYLQKRTERRISEGIEAVTKLEAVADSRKEFVKIFIEQNRNNVVGAHVFHENISLFSVAEIEAIMASFPVVVRAAYFNKQVLEGINTIKGAAVGAKYIDFTLNDTKDSPVRLSDHLGKGKYVLLAFWIPSSLFHVDISHLKEVYELYHPEGLEVISISMDADKARWLKAVEEEQMPWIQISDPKDFQGMTYKAYNANAIPSYVLISPDGLIADRNMRDSWMDKKLIELYGNKFGDKY